MKDKLDITKNDDNLPLEGSECSQLTGGSDSSCEDGDGKSKGERETWDHQLDFIMTMVGFTVGLGNVWRFPYLCMRNGGGSFLIPYFLFLFLCGAPLFVLEVAMGQFTSAGAIHVFANSVPLFKGISWTTIIICILLCIYYNVIITWILYYLIRSFTLALPWLSCDNWWNTPSCRERQYVNDNDIIADSNSSLLLNSSTTFQSSLYDIKDQTNVSLAINGTLRSPAEEFWQFEVLQITSGIHDLSEIRWQLALLLFLSWVLVFSGLIKGIKSLGKVVYITATLPYICLTILLIRGLTLPGAVDGILLYVVPKWEILGHYQVWCDGCSQIFYTLGPGWGALIIMSSYNKFDSNFIRNSMVCSVMCCGTSFFAGFVVFSILGFMAHDMGVTVDKVMASGPGLVFVAYPEALGRLPFAPIWAVIFFVMLLTLGVGSQYGMVENIGRNIADMFPRQFGNRKGRTIVTAAVCFLEFLLGIVLTCKGGMYVFQIIDWYLAVFSLWLVVLIEILAWCYIYGVNRVYDDMELMLGYRPSFIWKVLWCGVTPVMVLVVLVVNTLLMVPPTYGDYVYPREAQIFGWFIAILPIVPVPIVAIYYLAFQTKGSLRQRLRTSLTPTEKWGPAQEKNRIGTRYDKVSQQEEVKLTWFPEDEKAPVV